MSGWDEGTGVPDPESDPGDGWGVMTVRISHEEFLELKRDGFCRYALERMACRKLGITRDMIDDMDFDYRLTWRVWTKPKGS